LSARARLLGLATALPPHRFTQDQARAAAAGVFAGAFADLGRLLSLYDHAGIDARHSAMPLAWHTAPHGLAERNRLYLEHAETLLLTAASRALARAGREAAAVDAVVTVSSTGIATPSLDARIADRLGLRADVERTPLFGLGCAGGVAGLARGAALARAAPGAVVLVLVVELCTLTLRLGDRSKANLVACALFADGAAAAVLGTDGSGPELLASGEHRWPDTLDVMGWTVADDGLGVLFAVTVPDVVRHRVRDAATSFLARHGLDLAGIDRWIAHPGGAKVLSAFEQAFALPPAALDDSRVVLRDCGNMSAPTVLFVLERALRAPGWRRGLVTAMGPGFTGSFAVIGRDA